MFDAALSGQAVILADSRMTAADVAAGSLVRISPIEVDRHGRELPKLPLVFTAAKVRKKPKADGISMKS
ncbi:hypothetical protein AB9F29_02795 [Falsihalocynthiibacter sp. S25ZX9]|uniref:hypothetical protein n=1 Tax=Falsihalocynthiibacter sp. S25ZX9 TaxID=3240870 RepID=UPI0035101FDF